MCSIYNSSTKICERYYNHFLPVEGSSYSVFIPDFENFDKVKHGSTTSQITCIDGFRLTQISNKLGCQKKLQTDVLCSQTDEFMNCQECSPNYALDAQTGKCVWSTAQNCLIQTIQYPEKNFAKCLLCQKGYYFDKEYNKCKKYSNCSLINKNPPHNCLACKISGDNKKGDCKIKDQLLQQCEEVSYEGECLKCKLNEYFYLDVEGQKCQIRMFSRSCPNQSWHHLGDYCTSLKSNGEFFMQQPSFDKSKNDTSYLRIKSPQKYFQILQFKQNKQVNNKEVKHFNKNKLYYNSFGIEFIFSTLKPQKITKDEQCAEYSLFEDICISCKNGQQVFAKNNQGKKQYCSGASYNVYNSQNCQIYDESVSQCLKYPNNSQQNQNYYQQQPIQNCSIYSSINTGSTVPCLLCEDGYLLESNVCKKKNDLCHQYENPFIIIKEGCQECKQGFYFKTTKITQKELSDCKESQSNCLHLENDKCVTCNEGFTYNIDSQQCFQSEKLLNCKYSVGEYNICIECNQNYSLIEGICQLDVQLENTHGYCKSSKHKPNACHLCMPEYELTSDHDCKFVCADGSLKQNYQECYEYKCLGNCLNCPYNNLEYCYSCSQGIAPSEGKCKPNNNVQCLKNEYILPGEGQTCQKCPAQCSTCASKNKCITCVNPQFSSSTLCRCKFSQFLHQNECVNKCPHGWKKSESKENTCEEICQKNSYLVFDSENNSYKCVELNMNSDYQHFCQKLVSELPKMNINISNSDGDYFDLTFSFNQDFKKCFNFNLTNIGFDELQLVDVNQSDQQTFEMVSHIRKNDLILQQSQKGEEYAFVLLKVYLNNALQQTIKIKININRNIILSNEFQLDIEPVEKICQNCEIPINMQIQSSLLVQCKQSSDCTSKIISAQSDEEVEVVQLVSDSKYQNYTIEPFEFLFMKHSSDIRNNITILDYPYFVDKSQTGKIVYKFKIQDFLNNTTARITSKIPNLNKNRILESQSTIYSKNYKYLVQSVQIQTKQSQSSQEYQRNSDDDNDSSFSGKLIILLILVLGISVIGLIIANIYLKRRRNLDSQLSKVEIETKQFSQNDQELKKPHGYEVFKDSIEISTSNN
ncbi:hypothetical protein ABPG74_012487 [Tetrahymena malaccensis]